MKGLILETWEAVMLTSGWFKDEETEMETDEHKGSVIIL